MRIIVSSLVLLCFTVSAADTPSVPYPEGYRNWHHVKTTVIQQGHPMYSAVGGINHTYANDKAMHGYAAGTFPDGSVLVYDTVEAREANHAIEEGGHKVIGVMVKDSRHYAATGGWGFENFDAADPKRPAFGAKAGSVCYGCHTNAATRDHVYSRLRE